MSLAEGLAKTPPKTKRGPLWTGPCDSGPNGGVTFSLLSRFLSCRERFRLWAIEGLRPTDGFNHRIEYGSMWHVCEECYASELAPVRQSWQRHLHDYAKTLCVKYPLQQEQIQHWWRVVTVAFPEYIKYWAANPDVVERTPLLQETAFNVPYRLPSGREVRLRGKWDGVEQTGIGKDATIRLVENKTKGDIDEAQLKRQLSSGFDLQTQLYLVALDGFRELVKSDWHHDEATRRSTEMHSLINHSTAGVLYNVIRRPLSGGKGSIRQHKNESEDEFYERLRRDYIAAEPSYFFMRWRVDVLPVDIARFRRECLDPILEELCDWYQVVLLLTSTGIDPFKIDGSAERAYKTARPVHWRHPYGVFNAIDENGWSDLDSYLESGSEVGLRRTTTLFPELEE